MVCPLDGKSFLPGVLYETTAGNYDGWASVEGCRNWVLADAR